jgi:hypothetical protein
MRSDLDHIEDDPTALRRLWRRVTSGPVLAGSMLMLIALEPQGHASDRTGPSLPAFEETACDLPDLTPDIRPRLRCGTVRVPRDHARPESDSFALAVVVIRSAQQPALPDPVVYVSGGPGNPLTVYAAYQARLSYAPRRDLILVDQRGTGRSEPALCPDLERRLLETNLAVAAEDSAQALAKRRAAYTACRDQAVRRGIDPADFGTTVTGFRVGAASAPDRALERLRRVLWYRRRHDHAGAPPRRGSLRRARFRLSA